MNIMNELQCTQNKVSLNLAMASHFCRHADDGAVFKDPFILERTKQNDVGKLINLNIL